MSLLKVFPSTAASSSSRRSGTVKPSSRAAISACRVSGTSSASTAPVSRYVEPSWTSRPRSSSIRTVSTAYSGTPSALARICARSVSGSPGTEPGQQLLHRLLGERLEIERREAALPGAPGRATLDQLRPRKGDDEERMVPRPVEQVLDEVEQPRVGPLHVLEGEHGRVGLGQPLEEEPPGAEQLLLVARLMIGEAEQVSETRLDEGPLLRVEDVLVERGAQLLLGGGRLFVLGDPAAHAHHVRKRPVGHALAVRKAAAAVPVDGVRDPVEVLVELPGEP